jgi:hypothetical protein
MTTRLLTSVLLVPATSLICCAQLTLIQNGGFEDHSAFHFWTTDGDSNIWTANSNGFPPTEGTQYAELGTDLPPPPTPSAIPAASLEAFLVLGSGTLSTQGGGTAEYGTAITQTINITAANVNKWLSLRWDLVTEFDPSITGGQKDYAFITLSGTTSKFVVLGNIQSPLMQPSSAGNAIFQYETGWQTFNSFQFTAVGSYTLGIGVVSIDGSGGIVSPSGVLVDSVGLSTVPEPAEWGIVMAGVLVGFCVIRRLSSRQTPTVNASES